MWFASCTCYKGWVSVRLWSAGLQMSAVVLSITDVRAHAFRTDGPLDLNCSSTSEVRPQQKELTGVVRADTGSRIMKQKFQLSEKDIINHRGIFGWAHPHKLFHRRTTYSTPLDWNLHLNIENCARAFINKHLLTNVKASSTLCTCGTWHLMHHFFQPFIFLLFVIYNASCPAEA